MCWYSPPVREQGGWQVHPQVHAAAGAREELSPKPYKPARGGDTGLHVCGKIDDTGLCGKIDDLFGEFVVEDLAQGGNNQGGNGSSVECYFDRFFSFAFAAKSKGGDTISYRDVMRADPDGDAMYAAAAGARPVDLAYADTRSPSARVALPTQPRRWRSALRVAV